MAPLDPRVLALQAAQRGWLRPRDVWEAARRWAELGGDATAERVFEGLLTRDQIGTLSRSAPKDEETWPSFSELHVWSEPALRRPTPAAEIHDNVDLPATAPSPRADLHHAPASAALGVAPSPGDGRIAEPQITEPPPSVSLDDLPPASLELLGAPAPKLDLGVLPGQLRGPRYEARDRLGHGGVGEVIAALDREIGRVVAVKTLREGAEADPRVIRRFLQEARVTAQLEHPSIVPVYDLGALPDGQPYYTMRVVKKQSLRDVLRFTELRASYPLVRLLGVFLQVSRALAYAHSRGVLHGDLKPDNILLGDFGEVYLADWGLAKIRRRSDGRSAGSAPPPGFTSPTGGTPGYFAPEIARGEWDTIDERADLFSLGVMLYEILTGKHPFVMSTPAATVMAAYEKDPPRPRDVVHGCPLLLDDLCMALLEKDKATRPSSADEVAVMIEDYLEGAKEKERRRQEARLLCAKARQPVRRYHELEAERQRLSDLARRLVKDIQGWEAVERKRPVWALEDRAAAAERDAAKMLAEAIDDYTKALGYDAECSEAHLGLADLYWSRARSAEHEHQDALRIYYEALVTEHDDGRYAALMTARARLSIRSSPPGARVHARRYVERDRVLVPEQAVLLGDSPVRELVLEPGSWLVTLSLPGYRDVRYPVYLGRGAQHSAEVRLYREEQIGADFVYVPGGRVLLGGDPDAIEPLPRQEVDVGDFAITRFPVTMREYCAFLDDLEQHDAKLALKRAPHEKRGSEGMCVHRDAQGRWTPSENIIEGEARTLFPVEAGHLWQVPVTLIDWFDARAYCVWRSRREGVELRLASEAEWEKTARGADARFFPWGNRFDPTFCLMRDSRSFQQQPEPIGTFPTDESPYGARDMAGGMREWVADLFGHKTIEQLWSEPEPDESVERGASGWRMVRSGGWITDATWCRAASRGGQFALTRGMALGFRVAKVLRHPESDSM